MMSQVKNIEEIFREYFSITEPPDRIIELGTGSGEFTELIWKLRNEQGGKFEIITFDKTQTMKYRPSNIIPIKCDIFKNIEMIGDMIQRDVLILCDNGYKIKEVECLAPYMRIGDVIMAHDYAYDIVSFYRSHIWTDCEITYSDIRSIAINNSLVPFHQDLMESGAWLSLRKI